MSEPETQSLNALVESLGKQTKAINRLAEALSQVAMVNQQILEELLGEDDADQPKRDLAGRPITPASPDTQGRS